MAFIKSPQKGNAMEPRDILEQTRQLINEHGAGDADRWWYANRFVFSRLMLDERKTKAGVKQRLMDAGAPCHGCGIAFESKKDIHLHRVDANKAYSEPNCVLMHAECHLKLHASHKDEAEVSASAVGREPSLTKWSRRHDDKPFLYWWDIAPQTVADLESIGAMEFAKKDTMERCVVPVEALKALLTPERQTTRGQGHWGVKVLKDRPDELAFEPGTGSKDWRFMPIVWLEEAED